jgi:hypothetical protein
MIHLSRSALTSTCMLAACLLAPTLGIALQDQAALLAFHSRALSSWPEAQGFARDPVRYFQGMRTWAAERVFPIRQATQLQAEMLFLMGSPPEARVTLGEDGHVFLNGGTNDTVDQIFATTCIAAHEQRAVAMLERTFAARSSSPEGLRHPIDVIAVPTPASVYGDKLPKSVAPKYRQACLERVLGHSPLLSVRTTAPISFMYPLTELLAGREDDAFYPIGNYHPLGLSLKVVRDSYLARRQVPGSVDEQIELGKAPAEVLFMSGVNRDHLRYFIRNPHVQERTYKSAELSRWIGSLFVREDLPRVFTNSKPLIEERVLMLSDSYGVGAGEVFAGAFRQVVQVTVNHMRNGETRRLLQRIEYVEPFDRLIVLFQEGNMYRVAEWLAG